MDLVLNHRTADFATTGQLSPEDLTAVKAAGFKSVINNRPDFEGGESQPSDEDMEKVAAQQGLTYAYLPVSGGFQSEEEVAQFRRLLEELPKPVLAYCRSGTRSYRLFCSATQQA